MKINKQLKYNVLAENIERDNIVIDDKTPSVYEYAKYCVDNDDEFLNWLFDVDYDIHTYDINQEDEELLNKFLDYCK